MSINGHNLVTDSDGWILLLAYNHLAGENDPLVIGTAPSSPSDGYSHVWAGTHLGLTVSDIDAVRFYCKSEQHNRVVHFSVNNDWIKAAVLTGSAAGNQASLWTSGTTKLPGHTAYLPDTTTAVLTNTINGLLEFPMWDDVGGHVWSIRDYFKFRWYCDDQGTTGVYDPMPNLGTLHQIWFKKTTT